MPAQLFFNHVKHFFYTVFTRKKFLVADVKKYGLKFKFHIPDGIGRDIYYKHGVYSEDYITSFLLEKLNIKDTDLIIDIGANIGWYSLVLSSKNSPEVISFEPTPVTYSLLKENIELNGKKNVHAYNVAVSDKAEKLTLHLYKDYNPGRNSFIKQKNSISTSEVDTIRLDSFLKEKRMDERTVKLIKIDIEGYEYTAMSGALECLSKTEYIVSEFSPELMKQINQDPMKYINLLKNSGFMLHIIGPKGLTVPDFEQIIRTNTQVNLFCSKAIKN
jgi:FkbM family methyltransferase